MTTAAPPDGITHLYREHHGWLHGWLRHKLGCPEQAADLAHDTFLRLLRPEATQATLPGLREPRAYLTTIARGVLIDHWRRRDLERAWLDTLAALPEALAPSPEDKALALEALIRIDHLLDSLKPKVREAFLLAQIDGLRYREIGERLGVGERMIKKYIAQAMHACLLADLIPPT